MLRADDGLPAWAIAVIVVAAVALTLGVAAAVGIGASGRRGANHDAAPKKGPLCILFTDIESSTELWQAHDRMGEAVETHHAIRIDHTLGDKRIGQRGGDSRPHGGAQHGAATVA